MKGLAIAGALLALLACAASAPAATGCPTSGLGSGLLPDCRVYEQVSPVDKNAFEAGSLGFENPGVTFASADGSRTFYPSTGPMGETDTGLQPYTLSTRTAAGWQTRNAFPRPLDPAGVGFNQVPRSVLPNDDLSSFFFWAGGKWLPQIPSTPGNPPTRAAIDAYQFDLGQPLQWVTEPQDADALQPGGEFTAWFRPRPAGASPNLDRVYFTYLGTLLPGDEPRRPYAEENKASGVYEYAEGELQNAGRLPDGTLDPLGAAAAGSVHASLNFNDHTSPETHNNQVSADGRTLWFISPDPTPDAGRIVQLYVRVNGASKLVSRSELTDQPAATGVRGVPHSTPPQSLLAYVFAAADGSRAFFQSADRLTADAPEDTTPKAYMYEVSSGDLVYVPALDGAHVFEGSQDGSRLLFWNGDRTKIEIWEAGSGTTLVGETGGLGGGLSPNARATAAGSVFAFTLTGELSGFPNPSGLAQAYRYEVASGELDCLSCPSGGPPNSEAVMSRTPGPMNGTDDGTVVGTRAMSADGKWVFFDTAEALVPSDTNGVRDAYRWSEEDGPRLISTGNSGSGSFMMDISGDGSTAFFTTNEGIAPRDVDGSYDVYAARIGGGFPSTELPSCEGPQCRGPVAGPPALHDPVSETTRSRGNVGSGPRRLAARLNGRGGKLRLRVSAPAAGRIVVSGPRVQPLKRLIAKPGAYVLRPRLKPGARKVLDRSGHLMVRVKVRFMPREGRATSRVIATEVTR